MAGVIETLATCTDVSSELSEEDENRSEVDGKLKSKLILNKKKVYMYMYSCTHSENLFILLEMHVSQNFVKLHVRGMDQVCCGFW